MRHGGYGWKYESFAAVTQPYLLSEMDRFIPSAFNNFSARSILRVTAPDCFHYNQYGYATGAVQKYIFKVKAHGGLVI